MNSSNGTQGFFTKSGLPLVALTAKQTGEVLALSRPALWRLEKRGLLIPSRGIGHPRWLVSDVFQYMDDTKCEAL